MSLMELMVALAVLSLSAALVFTQIGPWLALSRASAEEASFRRALTPAQIVLSELAAGAVDPETRAIGEREARFRALAPRLSPTPIAVSLAIAREDEVSRLVFSAAGVGESVLIEAPARLRFADRSDALVVEIERDGAWRPLLHARIGADAPFVCAFDPIPRTCR